MSSSKITGKEYPLSRIFSSEFDYYIPAYQRPYAWTEEETEALFDDLHDFYNTEKEDNYFLGSIVLIKEENDPKADVIDGQQRLTTLTILLAVIASKLSGQSRLECQEFLREPGKQFQGLKATPRLHLRKKEESFFENYIQNIKVEELIKLNQKGLATESQQHIQKNAELLLGKINKAFGDDEEKLTGFISFLVQRCYLVVVYTASQQSAFRVFSVMNSRGLDLLPTDIIKADLIGTMEEDNRETYTEKWEDIENSTGRNGFNEIFTHIRMIFAKAKARKGLLDEFRQFVLPGFTATELIDKIIEPYAESYQILKTSNYESNKNAGEINGYLKWLNKIDNSDWMPCAIKFFTDNSNDPDYLLWFVGKLERLAAYMHATSKDINKRIDRYKSVLEEMENHSGHCYDDPLATIDLSDKERKEFLDALDGEIYRMTPKKRNYIILRLDSFVSDGAASYDPAILTIEHVLPQTIAEGSNWQKWWPDQELHDEWVHRIANLVPLTQKHNSEASNKDFDIKKNTYFVNKKGTTSYALTTQVIQNTEWTPEVIADRQAYLIDVFEDHWELSYDENKVKAETKIEKNSHKKNNKDLSAVRLAYWEYALPFIKEANAHRPSFGNVNPSKFNWISGFFGISGFSVNCVANIEHARVEFYLNKPDRDENKKAFDYLLEHRNDIESKLGISLEWEKGEEYRGSWIFYQLENVSVLDEEDWLKMAEFHAKWSDKICDAMIPYLLDIYPDLEKSIHLEKIAALIRIWAKKQDYIQLVDDKCSRTYSRFKTKIMSDILPDGEELSGWNTPNHYFYEAYNPDGKKINIKLVLSSEGLSKEEESICNAIAENCSVELLGGWKWKTVFRTENIAIGDDVDKEKLFKELDESLQAIKMFESNLSKHFKVYGA